MKQIVKMTIVVISLVFSSIAISEEESRQIPLPDESSSMSLYRSPLSTTETPQQQNVVPSDGVVDVYKPPKELPTTDSK